MNKLLIVANLKSYKTQSEALEWLEKFKIIKQDENTLNDKEIIICPPFTLFYLFDSFFLDNDIKVQLGAQDVSQFDEGPYTGEINAKQIKEFVNYVLIGHSERRKNFNEEEQILSKKTDLSLQNNLKPIFCVQNKETPIPSGVTILAYEPVFAIGSGNPDTPQNAEEVAKSFWDKNNSMTILYGGSVTSENVKSFTKEQTIGGVLVGGASLEAEEFIKIIKNA
jgi:triosephosphate isomerase